MKRFLFIFSALMLFSSQVFASGFAVKDQGTKAMGVANAFVAVADDTSAAWYNPAALAFQEGTSFTVGGQVVIPSVDFSGATTGSMDDKTHVIPFTYISYNNDALPVTLGLAINAPFGLSTDWTNSTASFDPPAGITFSQIQLININPVIAFKINDNLSIAGGFSYYLVNKVAFDNNFVIQHGDGDGFGGNAAIFYKSDAFNVGVTYHSRINVDVSGEVTAVAGGPLAAFPSESVAVSVTLPDTISAGIAFHPSDDWTLSAQYDWVNWKTFDSLDFAYGGAPGGLGGAITGGTLKTSVAENWKASNSFSVGAEWAYSSKMRARFGYAYDQTPVTDADFSPRISDNDRHFFTVGYGYSISDAAVIDIAYGYIKVNDRVQTASPAASGRNGTYTSDLHVISTSFSYHF